MALFSLPNEIIDMIMVEIVLSRGYRRSMRLAVVSRDFRTALLAAVAKTNIMADYILAGGYLRVADLIDIPYRDPRPDESQIHRFLVQSVLQSEMPQARDIRHLRTIAEQIANHRLEGSDFSAAAKDAELRECVSKICTLALHSKLLCDQWDRPPEGHHLVHNEDPQIIGDDYPDDSELELVHKRIIMAAVYLDEFEYLLGLEERDVPDLVSRKPEQLLWCASLSGSSRMVHFITGVMEPSTLRGDAWQWLAAMGRRDLLEHFLDWTVNAPPKDDSNHGPFLLDVAVRHTPDFDSFKFAWEHPLFASRLALGVLGTARGNMKVEKQIERAASHGNLVLLQQLLEYSNVGSQWELASGVKLIHVPFYGSSFEDFKRDHPICEAARGLALDFVWNRYSTLYAKAVNAAFAWGHVDTVRYLIETYGLAPVWTHLMEAEKVTSRKMLKMMFPHHPTIMNELGPVDKAREDHLIQLVLEKALLRAIRREDTFCVTWLLDVLRVRGIPLKQEPWDRVEQRGLKSMAALLRDYKPKTPHSVCVACSQIPRPLRYLLPENQW